MGTRAILDGSNEYAVRSELYGALAQPENRSQEQFVRAWELSGFLASDGFEWAFEQQYTGEELAAMLGAVGLICVAAAAGPTKPRCGAAV